MARFGKQPVVVPEGVKVEVGEDEVVIAGPKGSVSRIIPNGVEVIESGGEVRVERSKKTRLTRALQGTMRAHLASMIGGVTEGWSKTLEIVGAGYRAQVEGNKLVLSIGYSHPVEVEVPDGLNVKVEKNLVMVEGVDKELVGQFAAWVRSKRKPEPYKGTGIKYQEEVVRRKPGKQASSAAVS